MILGSLSPIIPGSYTQLELHFHSIPASLHELTEAKKKQKENSKGF